MSFVTKTFCTVCEQEVVDTQDHDCPKSPENIAKSEAEHAEWEMEFDRLDEAWDKWTGEREFTAIPSVSHTPDEIAFKGKCILVSLEHDWGGGYPYISAAITSPSWGRVFEEFDKSIHQTGDTHHSFLEGIGKLEESRWPEGISVPKNVAVLEFHTGS